MFSVALSGLRGASKELGVTSNNIANVNTTGFKGSRAEFGDLYTNSIYSDPKTTAGSGVETTNIRQSFLDGAMSSTGNSLDLAIGGQGFFMVSNSRETLDPAYTRAGQFGVDDSGFVVNSNNQYLMGFQVDDATGEVTSTSASTTQPLFVNEVYGQPEATSRIEIAANLNSAENDIAIGLFDPSQPNTFSHTTSTVTLDSLGNTHLFEVYYIKTDSVNNTWETRGFLDGTALTPSGSEQIVFDPTGELNTPANGEMSYDPVILANGSDPLNLTVDYSPVIGNPTTQYSAEFYVNYIDDNGSATGRLNGLEITDEGLLQAKYTNGEARNIGKLVLADFTNPEGLRNIGGTSWAESNESGSARLGEPMSGRLGSIQSGTLEGSNVDMTSQLIVLIQAQRNFQANAKSIEAGSNITQTIINLS